MHLTIITPDKELYKGEAILVQFPGSQGSFAVLPGHDKMIATLTAGEIRVVITDDNTLMIPIRSGVAEVNRDRILVLAN
jgi:F-type H+-transporting ATPase subunit epsilon